MALPKLSLKKRSEELVRDLIWFSNGFRIPPGVVIFGLPIAFPPSAFDDIQRNTRLELKGALQKSRYFKGSQIVFYRRIELAEMNPVSNTDIVITKFPFNSYDILPQINTKYGIALGHEDIFNIEYTERQGPFTIICRPESLAWLGQLTVDVYIDDGAPIGNTRLNGFKDLFPVESNLATMSY